MRLPAIKFEEARGGWGTTGQNGTALSCQFSCNVVKLLLLNHLSVRSSSSCSEEKPRGVEGKFTPMKREKFAFLTCNEVHRSWRRTELVFSKKKLLQNSEKSVFLVLGSALFKCDVRSKVPWEAALPWSLWC